MLLRKDLLRSYGKNICLFLLIKLVFFLDFLLCRIVCLVLFRLGFFYLGFDLFVYFEDILLFEMICFKGIFVASLWLTDLVKEMNLSNLYLIIKYYFALWLMFFFAFFIVVKVFKCLMIVKFAFQLLGSSCWNFVSAGHVKHVNLALGIKYYNYLHGTYSLLDLYYLHLLLFDIMIQRLSNYLCIDYLII